MVRHQKPVSQTEPGQRPLWQRLAWLVLIWGLSVGTLALVAFVIRLIMAAVGLSPSD